MKIKEDSIYIETGCAGEVLLLSDMYDEDKGKPIFLGICMSFYSYAHSGYDESIKNKLRHVWNIFTKGQPWKDELIFDVESAKKVRDNLTDLINKAEGLKK